MEARLNLGGILSRTAALLSANAQGALVILAILTGISTLMDLYAASSSASNLPVTVATMIGQYEISARLLSDAGLQPDGYSGRRYFALLGMSILIGLGTILGLLLLILPGIYLAVRWSIAVPALIGDNAGPVEAMGISWERTKSNVLPITLAFLVIFVPAFLVAGATLAASDEALAQPTLIPSLIANFLLFGATVVSWHAAVAIYIALTTKIEGLEEVFA